MELFDVVRLLVDLPAEGLTRGATGVIVVVFDEPERAYEVEFCDDDGHTVATAALKEAQLERMPSDAEK